LRLRSNYQCAGLKRFGHLARGAPVLAVHSSYQSSV
jgi:hypothetical protein